VFSPLNCFFQHAATTAPGDFDGTTGLLIFYYVTLGFFMLVCLFVLGSLISRFWWEFKLYSVGNTPETRKYSSMCPVKVLRYSLWVAFVLLGGTKKRKKKKEKKKSHDV
jgi:hypothetical protein